MTTKIKSGVISDNAITSAHISSGAISSAHLTSIDTDNITEGSSNLYFTTARVDSHLSGGTGVTYSSGAISIGQSVATSASPTFANLTLTGNLNITGDVDSVSVTDLDVTDKTITVGVGGTASANDGAGIVVDGASASILWDNSNTSWDFNNPIESSRVNTNTVNNVGNSANIIYRSSTNTIVGNNASALVVQDAGNVGIGTTSPTTHLSVANSGFTNSSTTGIPAIRAEGSYGGAIGLLDTKEAGWYAQDNGDTLYQYVGRTSGTAANASIVMTYKSSGNVGIGTTSPSYPLHVQIPSDGSIGASFRYTGGTNNPGLFFSTNESTRVSSIDASGSTTGILALKTSGTEAMRIDSSGNVAIGDSSSRSFRLYLENAGSSGAGQLMLVDSDNDTLQREIRTDAGVLSFDYWDSSNRSNHLTILANGNVGIGTSSPSAKLHVEVADNTEFLKATITGNESWAFKGASGSGATDYVSFGLSGSTQCMTWQEDGNVGIGTDSPDTLLHLNAVQAGSVLRLSRQDGSVVANDSLGKIEFYTTDVTNTGVAGYIDVQAEGGAAGGSMIFGTGTAGSASEQVRIAASGNVGIGTSDPDALLHVEGVTRTKYLRFQNLADATSEVAGMYSSSGGGTNDLTIYASALSSTSSNIKFLTAPTNSATTTTLFLEGSSGNVGIGVTNPSYALDVYDVGEAWIRADSSHTTESTANSGLRFAHGGVNHGVLYHRGSDDALLYFDNIASSTRFLLDSSGNFGINATSPTTRLNVKETGATIASGNAIEGSTQKGILLENTANDSTSLGLWYSSPNGNHQSGISFQRNDHNTTWGTDIRFYTHENATVNVDYTRERMRIDSEGDVLIGQTSQTGYAFAQKLVVGDGDANDGITIQSGSTHQGNLAFNHSDGTTAHGRISYQHNTNYMSFFTNNSEKMRIDTNGVRLEDGALAYEQIRPFFSGANAGSYSDSTNLAYTKSTDQYSITGEAFKARVRARAYTKYVHMKTNLSSDNIMFFVRIYGYFYNYGVNECVRGGYTYNGNVIAESVANAYNANSSYTIGDFYRSSSGGYLCIRLDVHQTGYTEGEALVFFGSHANSVTRELEITDMQHRDDGNNAY